MAKKNKKKQPEETYEEEISYTNFGSFTYRMTTKKENIDFSICTEQTMKELPAHIIILEIGFDMHGKLIITIPRNKILLKRAEEMRERMLRYALENYPRDRGTEVSFIHELIAVSIHAHRKIYKE